MRLSFCVLPLLLLLPASVAAQTVPPVVAAAPEPPDATRDELLRRAREAKKDIVHPPQKTGLEKLIARIEPFVMDSPVRSTSPKCWSRRASTSMPSSR